VSGGVWHWRDAALLDGREALSPPPDPLEEEAEETPIELEYRDVAKLLLTALACLAIIAVVTFGLHVVRFASSTQSA